MSIPEGANTVTTEASDLKSAVAAAATELGIEPNFVAHKIDLSHFRSETGGMVSRDTVKIIAWQTENEQKSLVAPPRKPRSDDDDRPRRDRDDRRGRDRDRDERRGRGRDRDERRGRGRDRDERRGRDRDRGERKRKGAEEGTTDASDFAAAWLQTLLEHLELEGTVTGTGSDERVHLDVVISGRAGRLIGKRGATLRSIRRLLQLALDKNHTEGLTLDVDVNDDRPKEEARAESDDRGDRRRGRNRRGRRDDRGKHPEEKLTALAQRAAEKALETNQTITIQLELNSYDRRIVHVAIAEIDGVESRSEERTVTDDDGNESVKKFVQVVVAEGGDDGDAGDED